MTDALLSHDDAVVTSVAEDAIEMDECYLDEFAPDYPDFPAHYYSSKSKAALALGDPSAPEFIERLAAATDELPDPGPFWQTAPTFYRAISAGEQSDAQRPPKICLPITWRLAPPRMIRTSSCFTT